MNDQDYRKTDENCRKAYFTYRDTTPGLPHSVSSFVAGWNAAMEYVRKANEEATPQEDPTRPDPRPA